MAKEQLPKRSIADLLSATPAQPETRPLTEAEIDATTHRIHYEKQPASPLPAPALPSTVTSPPRYRAQPRRPNDDAITRISFDVTISMFVKMKEKALRNHQTMRDYLTKLVENDLGPS